MELTKEELNRLIGILGKRIDRYKKIIEGMELTMEDAKQQLKEDK